MGEKRRKTAPAGKRKAAAEDSAAGKKTMKDGELIKELVVALKESAPAEKKEVVKVQSAVTEEEKTTGETDGAAELPAEEKTTAETAGAVELPAEEKTTAEAAGAAELPAEEKTPAEAADTAELPAEEKTPAKAAESAETEEASAVKKTAAAKKSAGTKKSARTKAGTEKAGKTDKIDKTDKTDKAAKAKKGVKTDETDPETAPEEKPAASAKRAAGRKKKAAAGKQEEPAAAIVEELVAEPMEPEGKAPLEPEKQGGEPMSGSGEKLRVLLVGSECVPFAKTGGLADVLGTLPQALNKLDVDARVMIPFHKQAKEKFRMQTQHVTDFYIYMGWKSMFVGIDRLDMNGVVYYLIDNEEMYGGKIYKGGIPEGEQYAFFCRAVCEAMDRIDFLPQVVHCNDWQTGMIPMLLKTQYLHRPQSGARTVFSIHNLMYQGQYAFKQIREWLGIEERYNTPEFIEHFGCASFMKAGLVFGDWISTVSPTYAKEIRLPYFSYGMEGILNARAHETTGILNGMNVEEFNPATDPNIPYHFDAEHPENKRKDKEELLKELGLYGNGDTPVISMVGRLTHQKGLNLLMPVFDELMREDVTLIILGTGDAEYENFFRGMEAVYRGRVCAYIGYSDAVAHRLYAGSDLFLMPSKFEPCGISQMIALRYGTLPIVRETGGLKDTVIPFNEFTGEGNGFSFTNYDAHDMLNVIRYALYTIRDKNKLATLRKSAFAADYSFAKSAELYRDMFRHLV